MMQNTPTVTPESLPRISYRSNPVVTTAQLAFLYGTSGTNISSNMNRNRERFVVGKHYFLLEGHELRSFKNEVTIGDFAKIAKTVNHLTLWTERGAARHAKMLDTDQAWDVFERLEECYFNKKADPIHKPLPATSAAKISPYPLNQSAVNTLNRCSGEAMTMVYMLIGYIESRRPFRIDLRYY